MCYNSRSIASSSLDIMSILGYGVFASFVLSLILLTAQVLRARSFGRRLLYSLPEGDPRKGVSYALGRGMMPWEKESAAKHLPTYLGGVLYHAGVFAAVVLALCLAAGLRPPPAGLRLLRDLAAAGFLAGIGLLFKRAVKPGMRHISCPDDYLANILVDFFVLAGFLSASFAAAAPPFLILSIATFLYMPLGKIRHCFFFFYSRILFGAYFGRRGVLPGKRRAPREA
ncbi:MAG TPA: hypothetical protein PLX50_07800 [Candidatus Aminicenantes bacterium]|nr:hypothetical protein [Candidatus Aminicenantes bacterium]